MRIFFPCIHFHLDLELMTGISNITAPPFVLADKSTTELPRYWIEYPDLFTAPANEEDASKRLLAVLKWFLVRGCHPDVAARLAILVRYIGTPC